MLPDFDHQVGQAVQKVIALTQRNTEPREHASTPAQDVFAQHLVRTFTCQELLLLGTQQLVLVELKALVVAFWDVLGVSFSREYHIFVGHAVVETIF